MRWTLTQLLVVLSLSGCVATEQGPREVAHEPEPPAPLGELERVVLNGQLVRALPSGAPLRIDAEVDFAAFGEAGARLAIEVRDEAGRVLGVALADPLLEAGASQPVAARLDLPDTRGDGPFDLDLFVVGADVDVDVDVDENSALRPRSQVLRTSVTLTAPGDSTGLTRRFDLGLGGAPTGGTICDDGRVIVAGPEGVAVIDPHRADGVQRIALPDADAPVRSMIVDWRCARAYATSGERFVVVDLLGGEVIFDEVVAGLLDVVFDVNPRYVMLLLADGRLRRYYLRDDEWSDYNGRLPAAPLRSDDGSLVLARDDHRLAIATTDGALCVIVDTLDLEPRCVALPVEPVAVSLVPFGFADERFAEHDTARATQWYDDDLESRQLAEQTDDAVLGAAVLVAADRELSVFGLDAGFVAARHALDLDAHELVAGRHGELVALGPHAEQAVDPLDSGAQPPQPLVADLEPDTATRLWPAPDRSRSAWFDAAGLQIAARTGERLGFVVGPTSGRVLWSADGHMLAVLTDDAVYVIVPDGIGDFVPAFP